MVTLYKKDKKGNLTEWSIEHDEKSYWTLSGKSGGKMRKSAVTEVKKKKSSKLSLEEEVIKVVNCKIEKQLNNGYTREISSKIESFNLMMPIAYSEQSALDFPYEVEHLIGGLRVFVKCDGEIIKIFTADGEEVVSCPHITENEFIKKFFELHGDAVIDAKLYNHEKREELEKLISIATSSEVTDELISEAKELIELYCVDSYYPSEPELNYVERKIRLAEIIKEMKGGKEAIFGETYVFFESVRLEGIVSIKRKDTEEICWWLNVVKDDENAKKYLNDCVNAGYKGILLKKYDCPYQFGLTNKVLELKK
jgi:ATP-dependent DNA ligase